MGLKSNLDPTSLPSVRKEKKKQKPGLDYSESNIDFFKISDILIFFNDDLALKCKIEVI